MRYAEEYLENFKKLIDYMYDKRINTIEEFAIFLKRMKEKGGRLFLIGVGGGAANASHAVNDFRKICNIEAYTPTDNVAELTARTNDDGWGRVFEDWLRVSKLNDSDVVMILSVGGGTPEASFNIARAVQYARQKHATILGLLGRKGGWTHMKGNLNIVLPERLKLDDKFMTPFTESLQSVVLHAIVNHPDLKE
ncbi:MAG: SIS domain-containing protein [Nitrososphaeria archaeon]|nr:SIS domain-containing protein [Nitrososphaeria archaeon]NIQ34272.1 SIS domain-containing protein [Nitrososphaeria archaeon]